MGASASSSKRPVFDEREDGERPARTCCAPRSPAVRGGSAGSGRAALGGPRNFCGRGSGGRGAPRGSERLRGNAPERRVWSGGAGRGSWSGAARGRRRGTGMCGGAGKRRGRPSGTGSCRRGGVRPRLSALPLRRRGVPRPTARSVKRRAARGAPRSAGLPLVIPTAREAGPAAALHVRPRWLRGVLRCVPQRLVVDAGRQRERRAVQVAACKLGALPRRSDSAVL